MKTWRPTSRLRRAATVAAVACLATTAAAALTATPASATDPIVSNVSLSISNNVESATATYTWGFTLGAGDAPTALKLKIPTAATWTVSAADVTVYGLVSAGCGTVTPSFTSPTISLAIASCSAITASTPVAITVANISNGTAADTTFKTSVGVNTSTAVDAGSATAIADDTTSVTVLVPESLTFAGSGSSITLLPIPGSGPVSAPVALTVATNAAGGYTLAACVKTDITANDSTATTKPKIAQAPTTATANSLSSVATGQFGAVVAPTASQDTGAVGSPVIGATGWSSTSGSYAGYSTTCTGTNPTTSHDVIASDSGPATLDTIAITNAAAVPATQAGGTYTGTITYVVTPTY